MTDWTSGYVADIGYTFGYYGELNPLRVKLAFLNAGLAAPRMGTACELGFGQGLSANLHAAASEVRWYGTDFNPSQAAYAQEIAAASGAGAQLYDDAFAEFAARPDLPDFDYIGLHGIWSWISDQNRHVIVDFLRKKLKVGGVLYISYNTLPGWGSFAPMRHLMTQHADVLGAEGGGIVSRIDGALDFAEKLLATNPGFARANPLVADRVRGLKKQNRHYLAHEYFNRDWHPMHFATMAEWLDEAKLQYACPAHWLDHVDLINLSTEQQAFLAAIPDVMFRESVRDFMVNQQFRRDYWVRGARKLSAVDQAQGIRALRFILTADRAAVTLEVTGALGKATMSEEVYAPILDALAGHQIMTFAQLEQIVRPKNVSFSQLLQAVMILAGLGHLSSVQDEAQIARVLKRKDGLNNHLLDKARGSADVSYLASPVTGGGVVSGRVQQLFIVAQREGAAKAADLAQWVWQVFSAQNQKLLKDGSVLQTEEENLAELTAQAQRFLDQELPILKALKIVV